MDLFGGTPKYAGTGTDPIDGVPLSWRAHPDGLPVRQGDAPDVVSQQAASQARATYFARSKVFKIPEELEEYTKTLDWVINTTGHEPREMTQVVGEGRWVVWMTWADVRGYIPKTPLYPGMPGR